MNTRLTNEGCLLYHSSKTWIPVETAGTATDLKNRQFMTGQIREICGSFIVSKRTGEKESNEDVPAWEVSISNGLW
jgi:hypothetical protein